jgi:molybdenum cofactor biosynthesis enzyme MoaA
MCDGLYVKANGELPCWCDVGEDLILDVLTADKLMDPAYDLINHDKIRTIRTAFHVEQRYPYDLCRRCAMVEHGAEPNLAPTRTHIDVLHIESSWLCNLDCPLCIPKAERKRIKGPPYHFERDTWVALIHNLRMHGVDQVNVLHFEGRGDPLMHPHLAHLCRVFHVVFPHATIMATTNGNFRFDPALFEAGLSHLRISADGARDASYVQYRRDGNFLRVVQFMRDAVQARRNLDDDSIKIEWKYILFEWNDSDEEMIEAYTLANELDVELSFCLTPWAGKSLRFDQETLDAKLETLMPNALNRPTRHVEHSLSVGQD